MGLEPITVMLTSFDKLETLRAELKAREEDLQNIERELRGAMRLLATRRYLKSVSPFYASQPPPPEAAGVADLEQRRQALYGVIQAIRGAIRAWMPPWRRRRRAGKGAAAVSSSRITPESAVEAMDVWEKAGRPFLDRAPSARSRLPERANALPGIDRGNSE